MAVKRKGRVADEEECQALVKRVRSVLDENGGEGVLSLRRER
ncbi:hypothetical protein LOCC1_G007333, partial [Lachnellula occidentalis]